nr:MAG TPA: hypothetical protein [Caudoviricetes sp.]
MLAAPLWTATTYRANLKRTTASACSSGTARIQNPPPSVSRC